MNDGQLPYIEKVSRDEEFPAVVAWISYDAKGINICLLQARLTQSLEPLVLTK
jgi:hypothetical protein